MQVSRPRIMGVVNVTPDSFSDGGRFLDHRAAVDHGYAVVAQGADWVDVGGESTRPGATPVPVDEELRRVLPVVAALAGDGVAVSIDTRTPQVANAAVAAGARLVNDISASPEGAAAAAAGGAGFVAMHMRGEPRTMQDGPTYHDVVAEVRDHLVARADAARAQGVAEVWIDPGIGFGKTLEHNLALLAHLDELVATGYPVLVGTSRKGMLGVLAARADVGGVAPPATDRLEGSVATAVWSARLGAAMVRVHDVAATVRALEALERPAAPAA